MTVAMKRNEPGLNEGVTIGSTEPGFTRAYSASIYVPGGQRLLKAGTHNYIATSALGRFVIHRPRIKVQGR